MAYRAYVNDLLNCKKEVEYQELVDIFKSEWSIPFLQYYESFLEGDVVKSAQWKLNELGILGTGITTNVSEALNCVLKRFFEWEEVKVNAICLGLYQLCLFYCLEIKRGLRLLGEWHLKQEFISERKMSTLTVSSAILSPKDIIKHLKDKLEKKSQHKIESFPRGKIALANLIVAKNMVHLHSPSRTFIVENLEGKSNAVNISPDSCSCVLGNKCVHILVAQIASQGKPVQIKKPSFSLSDLSRKIRGDKKSGKKGPLTKKEIEIIPAPDSSRVSGFHADDSDNDVVRVTDLEEKANSVKRNPTAHSTPKRKEKEVKIDGSISKISLIDEKANTSYPSYQNCFKSPVCRKVGGIEIRRQNIETLNPEQ